MHDHIERRLATPKTGNSDLPCQLSGSLAQRFIKVFRFNLYHQLDCAIG
jgi:hypothetical protein